MPTSTTTVQLLAREEQDTDWMAGAACRHPDVRPEAFFPVVKGSQAHLFEAEAKAVCARCPVLEECREWALNVQEWGIAGGLSEEERRTVRRARAEKAQVAS